MFLVHRAFSKFIANITERTWWTRDQYKIYKKKTQEENKNQWNIEPKFVTFCRDCVRFIVLNKTQNTRKNEIMRLDTFFYISIPTFSEKSVLKFLLNLYAEA